MSSPSSSGFDMNKLLAAMSVVVVVAEVVGLQPTRPQEAKAQDTDVIP